MAENHGLPSQCEYQFQPFRESIEMIPQSDDLKRDPDQRWSSLKNT